MEQYSRIPKASGKEERECGRQSVFVCVREKKKRVGDESVDM